ncbi:hypothetical protein [Pedobacter sp. SYSU D00535]|uniref:hypothetical protein n=1 Tax=Pedobacter sp. SYSU D00535 TaxID=2810308 RepID=UPI001A95B94B|nr:hypothetical protein [Pedobacter sp. SYSU D00535]
MKTFNSLATLLSAILIILAGCKKDKTEAALNSAPLLKSISRTSNGIVNRFTVSYDIEGRLESVANAGDTEGIWLSYDLQGNIEKLEELKEGVRKVYTIRYENNLPSTGKVEQFTNGEFDFFFDLVYTVENQRVTRIVKKYFGMTQISSTINYEGNNVKKIENHVHLSPVPTFISYVYGEKRSALSSKPIKYILDPDGISSILFSENEILSETRDMLGSTNDQEISRSYSYNSLGFPVSCAETSSNSASNYTFIYQ